MHEYTISISDTEKKALEENMESIQTWLDNAIHVKARKCIDRICKRAFEEEGILTEESRAEIATEFSSREILVADPSNLPGDLKEQIVAAAQVKSVTERNQEILEV